jgi:hypothetical protein
VAVSFTWWRKPEYPKKTTDLPQFIDILYHIKLYRVHLARVGLELTLVVLGTDCIGSYKSNYHTIITAPLNTIKVQLNFVEIDGTNDFTLN